MMDSRKPAVHPEASPPTKRAGGPVSDRMLGLAATGVAAGALALRFLLGERPLDAAGPTALLESAYAIVLATSLALLALSLGDFVLSLIALGSSSTLERGSFSLGLGLGLMGYILFGLGLLGALRPGWIGTGLIIGYAVLHR